MPRHRLLAAGIVLAMAAAACSSPSPQSEAPISDVGWVVPEPSPATPGAPTPTAPNIVFVLTDDLTWNLVRYMPHVQAMMREGVTFDRYFVSDSFCCPSRASIFTGEFPHNTGVFTNGGPDGGIKAYLAHDDQDRSYALQLQQAGYQTGFFGKLLNLYTLKVAYEGQRPWVAPGWSAWGPVTGGYGEYNYGMALGHEITSYGHGPGDYLTNVLGEKAMGFIATSVAAHQPFMTEISTFAPHSPFRPAPKDRDRFTHVRAPQVPSYGRAVTHAPDWLQRIPPLSAADEDDLDQAFVHRVQTVQAVDRMVGRLQDQLRQLGVADNTYVVFSSDNGLHLGEHNLRQGKETAFDTDIRVPLVVTGPGVKAGATVSQLAENVDLAPTFETMAGRTPPATVDGHSLTPLLGGATPADWRGAILVEHHGPLRNPADPDYQSNRAGNPPTYEAIRTGRYLYVRYVDGEHEFYDLAKDPFELHNRFDTIPLGLWLRLESTLERMSSCQGTTSCWNAQHVRL